ncbi:MAG: endonuclease domain-containing protein [Deltaproteobacteria bacterium]
MSYNKNDMFLGANPLIFQRAEVLRKKVTEAEKILWEVLKTKKLNGYKFRRQHPILKFILDFYCHESKLGIEIDGQVHNSKEQRFYDEDRTDILKEYGIKIIRFHNNEIIENLEVVKLKILSELKREI